MPTILNFEWNEKDLLGYLLVLCIKYDEYSLFFLNCSYFFRPIDNNTIQHCENIQNIDNNFILYVLHCIDYFQWSPFPN